EAIRAMIESIVGTALGGGGVNLELSGDLARILAPRSASNARTPAACGRGSDWFACLWIWLRGPDLN
ncbi:hypothetical protein, partial [Bosea sp. LjRoot237]